jgi:hypothetical protein
MKADERSTEVRGSRVTMLAAGAAAAAIASTAFGAIEMTIGASAYLSAADIPSWLYAAGSPAVFEDFEDGDVHPSIGLSDGQIVHGLLTTDSVDGDDGVIDGLGRDGHCWYHTYMSRDIPLVITFDPPVHEAAFVITDASLVGFGALNVHYEITVFGPAGELGSMTAFVGNDDFYGSTDDDRLFTVRSDDAIVSVRLRPVEEGRYPTEVDHIQSGMVADPGCNPADLSAPFGSLTFGDVSAFVDAFSSRLPAADLAEPFGQFTFGDISAFVGAFSAGCP